MKTLLLILLLVLVSAGGMYGFLHWRQRTTDAEVVAAMPPDPLQPAIDLAAERGCSACHSIDGSKGIGPSWMGSYGTMREFQDGTFLVVDEEYLRESMLDPAARVVDGFDNVMVPAPLSEQDISTFIGLIHDLSARMPM